MTEQERNLFKALVVDRAGLAAALKKRAARGIKDNAINKYSDQAHFIYELLQNADDAGATAAYFKLLSDRLVFAHNGTRRFSISDPATEDEDSDNGKLGDINSITSYYNSTKTEASIGKFGIGFKAVLQYTDRPEIYDDKFRFCIEDQIVPVELSEDYPGRKAGETLFVFPFANVEIAYRDIANKLRSLSYPILFLSCLQSVSFSTEEVQGVYHKKQLCFKTEDGTRRELLHMLHDNGDAINEEDLWLFSREDDAGRSYSVGFPLDEAGTLRPIQTDAYCFFKTKEHTGLNFFVHAPFKLNDSREHIVSGEPHNHNMIKLLAELAADSLVFLRDIGLDQGSRLINDNILNIIPTDEDVFGEDTADRLSFLPFYTAILEKMSTDELLPTVEGYVDGENAYWADTEEIAEIISTEQLAELADNPHARWAFISIGRDRGRARFTEYIDQIIGEKWCDENAIISGRKLPWSSKKPNSIVLSGLNSHFIETQNIEWLHSFYKWLSGTDNRIKRIKTVPIFLNQDGHASSAFDERNEPILFLPSDGIEGMNTIAPELLDNPDTRDFIERKVGIKQPSRKDYIYNRILPQYIDGVAINTKPHFQLFFDYYTQECPLNEVESFLGQIRHCKFLIYHDDEEAYRDEADQLYFPDSNLRAFFANKPDTKFVDWDGYLELVGNERKEDLRQFLSDLGVHSSVQFLNHTLNESDEADRKLAKSLGLPSPYSPKRWIKWNYPVIDGVDELLHAIVSTKDCEKSLLLWNELLEIIKCNCSLRRHLIDLLRGKCEYFYYHDRQESFLAPIGKKLRECVWLMDRDSCFFSPNQLTVGSMNEGYDLSDDAAEELIHFLQIEDNDPIAEGSGDTLTDEQREKIAYAEEMLKVGMTKEEFEQFKLWKQSKYARSKSGFADTEPVDSTSGASNNHTESDADRAFRKSFERQSPARKSVIRSIMQDPPDGSENPYDEEETESDEYNPPAIDFHKRIQRAEEKSRMEVDKIAREQELSDQLSSASRYTYAWLRALMELEALSRNGSESGSREISICFGKVDLEQGTERTLLLKQPNRYIPHWMEDLAADVPLTLQLKGREQRVMIEVASVKGYTLHTRLRNAEAIKGLDLSSATASISVQNPGFLLESLQAGFAALNMPDDYDLKANLSESIKFVFGPPGTGKTTYLAREELIPQMQGTDDEKVLVLAPTNKAADVLAIRIMELMGADNSYMDWLIRFGTTFDENIEQSEVYKDRSFYLPKLRRFILITTIARFPYDSICGTRLCDMDWDRVVIDEASMIPVANIIYPLYRSKPKKFIIAGDPLQIQPIAQVEQDENIYKMVGLKSFTNPHTEPHDYEVKLLTTQYRSIPSIGEVFSQFAYGGVLKHARSEDSRRQLNIGGILSDDPLSIIKFPVKKYEGIYRAKKLRGSPYQVYSALFTYEFAAFLADKVGTANPSEIYSIGVISPYRVQADLISRLLVRTELPSNVNVQAGTIHGYHGDECDIIITMFNPPPYISDRKDMFLNKLNIINVSISRAREKLFILMPDAETEHIERLKLVNKVERLIKNSEMYTEYRADEIEELIFGRTGYLEENTFSTSHQNVNVYGMPEKRYEVRSEETAIDVQIHEGV